MQDTQLEVSGLDIAKGYRYSDTYNRVLAREHSLTACWTREIPQTSKIDLVSSYPLRQGTSAQRTRLRYRSSSSLFYS